MLRVVFVVALLINLIACSSTPTWKGIYSSGKQEIDASDLEVPPDLSQPNLTDSLALPNIAAGQSTYLGYTNTSYSGDKVTPDIPNGIKVIRDGVNMWLEINSTAEKIWPKLKDFFVKVGFEIKREDKKLGVIETNWLESKVNLPTTWYSKLLNRVSSTGLKDKYRVRLEKTNKQDVTLLFITHQGLKEYGTDDISSIKLWWQTRPSDPELEAEMYQRFLIYQGVSRTNAIDIAKQVKEKDRARIFDKEGTKMLQVGEGFARTWRRVGIALDRIGLFVEDRNRSDGVYYLRITEDFRNKVKVDKGWFSSIFSGGKVKLKERYLLSVNEENNNTIISIVESTGAKANDMFVNILMSDLKTYLE